MQTVIPTSNGKIIIPIDHGNRNIKTLHHVFPASFIPAKHLPGLGVDIITYEGNEYALVDKRAPEKIDKTQDDTYFILTLFAIGCELSQNLDAITSPLCEIILLAGLPPENFKAMHKRYAEYFKGPQSVIGFTYNGHPMNISITDVYVYPQAYAAVVHAETNHPTRFSRYKTLNIIDIGGYTADLMLMHNFKPDLTVCFSLYDGVNELFKQINALVRAQGKKEIPDGIIEGVLLGDADTMLETSQWRVEIIRTTAVAFAANLMGKIAQHGLDMQENHTVFIGGGAVLLRSSILQTQSESASKFTFVDNVHANAAGYAQLYEIYLAKQQRLNQV